MTCLQMPLVCVSSLEPLFTVDALERRLACVSAEVLFEMRRMPELAVTFCTGESGGVVMDEHVVLQRMLPRERRVARTTCERLYSGVTSIMRDQCGGRGKRLIIVTDFTLKHKVRFCSFTQSLETAERHLPLPTRNHPAVMHLESLGCLSTVHERIHGLHLLLMYLVDSQPQVATRPSS